MTVPTQIHTVTPLQPNPKLASTLQVSNVLLKLDNLQPSQSFKTRGLGYSIQRAKLDNPRLAHIVSSSGGNAGFAATLVAKQMGLAITVFVPSTTTNDTCDSLRKHGATVVIAGNVWDEAHESALKFLDSLEMGTGFLVHPFEGENTWIGHSTLIDEVIEQSQKLPDVVICSVGGGGLLCGILTGLLRRPETPKTIVVAVETSGAASFAAAVAAGKLVTIDEISSIAKSLGAKRVSEGTLRLRDKYGTDLVRSLVVTDAMAVNAVDRYFKESGYLVEPACGATLAAVYYPDILKAIVPELTFESTVIVEVCGGFQVSHSLLELWKQQVNKN